MNIAIFDVTTHCWDLATATGQSTDFDPEVLEAAWMLAPLMLTDEYRAAGMYGAVVEVPDDAPLQDKLAAFTGRTPLTRSPPCFGVSTTPACHGY